MVALLGLSSGLPDAADGASAQADDPGGDHAAEEGEDFLAEGGSERGEKRVEGRDKLVHQRASVRRASFGTCILMIPPRIQTPTPCRGRNPKIVVIGLASS
jgi:hypothetical protein